MNAIPFVLANQLPPAPSDWAPIALMFIIGIGFAAGNVILSALIGPGRTGKVKGGTYESGMVPFGDTRKRFNVRFYIVAMIFLVIDVEIVFFYPFATIFSSYAERNPPLYDGAQISAATAMFACMIVFVAILLLAYAYAWGKGVFRWD